MGPPPLTGYGVTHIAAACGGLPDLSYKPTYAYLDLDRQPTYAVEHLGLTCSLKPPILVITPLKVGKLGF